MLAAVARRAARIAAKRGACVATRAATELRATSAPAPAVTAGAGAAVSLGSVSARVAAQAPRFAAILAALRATAASIAASARTTHTTVQLHRARLERFLRVPARNERGALALGRPGRQPGWLKAHEHSGSHTISAHVGKSVTALRRRCLEEGRPICSSFRNQADAERVLATVFRRRRDEIDDWLTNTSRAQWKVEDVLPGPTGMSVRATGPAEEVNGVRAILVRDSSMPDGYRVLTSFPQPSRRMLS